MKRSFALSFVMLFSISILTAHPVSVEKAKAIGQRFVQSNFDNASKSDALQLVYTGVSSREEVCFYAFNIGQEGFVIVSADDRFRPIVGYSDEGPFATENPSPEAMFYLDKIIEARTSRNVVLFDDTAEEWQSVATTGKLLSRNGGRSVDYLCATKWNQNAPYNLYAPAAQGGPGDRCYAGCVATAMSQVMKYWNHPAQGTGSHSYYCQGYGTQSANFGQTTYDWDNMPDQVYSNLPQEQIEAVATLMYHCAVAVDMGFSPSGSGASSWDVPRAIRQYFSYFSHADLKARDSYSLAAWQLLLKNSFDTGWPVYYSGYSETAGHAFVCDGYDDNDLFHFNWGWGGSSDGWFVVDEIDYAGWAQAIFNYVPADVYDYMPLPPDNLSVTSLGDFDYSATLTWTNPTHDIRGNALTAIDQIVVTRDGVIIHTEENLAPGVVMSFTDHYMPTVVRYGVYAVVHNARSLSTEEDGIVLGPNCIWHIDMTSDDSQGWNNGAVSFVNSCGIEIDRLTLESTSASRDFIVPMGHVSFCWNKPSSTIGKIGFVIKDDAGNVATTFEGSSNDLDKGVFYIANNSCGSDINHNAPTHLVATRDGNVVNLVWDAPNGEVSHYYIYKDNVLSALTDEARFSDENGEGFHTYFVTAVNLQGESDPTNVENVFDEGLCDAPRNLRYEMTTSTKAKIMWDAPEDATVTGYMVYRRGKGEEFSRIKLLTTTQYTDNLNSRPDGCYEYAVTAYFEADECESGYAASEADATKRYIEVNKSIIPQRLDFVVQEGHIVLQWQEASMAESYNIYRDGQRIGTATETTFTDEEANNQNNYRYTVTGCTPYIESNPSNEAFVNWSTDVPETADASETNLYPNPVKDQLTVEAVGLCQIKVFNVTGQEVKCMNVKEDRVVIDLSAESRGCYFIEVTTDSGCTTHKVVRL